MVSKTTSAGILEHYEQLEYKHAQLYASTPVMVQPKNLWEVAFLPYL